MNLAWLIALVGSQPSSPCRRSLRPDRQERALRSPSVETRSSALSRFFQGVKRWIGDHLLTDALNREHRRGVCPILALCGGLPVADGAMTMAAANLSQPSGEKKSFAAPRWTEQCESV